jgi:putative hemolysin
MKSFKAFIAEGENKQVKGGDPCWSGYEMVGKKKKNGKEVPNCVPVSEETVEESAAWQKKAGKNPEGGLNRKGIASYRAEHPGSHLSMAVTTPPSKLKPGSKAANRRKSFCARMGGMEGSMKKPNGEPTRKALALRKWNC